MQTSWIPPSCKCGTRLEQDDVAGALRLIEALMPADRADVFEELPLEQQQTLLPHLENEDAADILEELGDEQAAALAGSIDAGQLAPILDEMEPDEAADLLGDLEQTLSSAALEQMQDSDEVMPLLLHADQTAGGLMTSEYLAFPAAMRVDHAIEAVRRWEPKGEESPYLFVVDASGHLVGVARLFKALRAAPETRLSALMERDVVRAYVDDDQETAARKMGRYDLVVMPVIDHEERLVGVITIDDLVDVLEEEARGHSAHLGLAAVGSRIWFPAYFQWCGRHRLAAAVVRHGDADGHGDAHISGSAGRGGGAERVHPAAGGHRRKRRLADHRHHHPRPGRGRHRAQRFAAGVVARTAHRHHPGADALGGGLRARHHLGHHATGGRGGVAEHHRHRHLGRQRRLHVAVAGRPAQDGPGAGFRAVDEHLVDATGC